MGINLKQVIKALELHANAEKSCVDECPYGNMRRCGSAMAKDAISLIKELTEENERLRKHNAVLIEDNHILSSECIPMAKADTVRKMQEKVIPIIESLVELMWDDNEANCIVESCNKPDSIGCGNRICIDENKALWIAKIDQIAKEMVEG